MEKPELGNSGRDAMLTTRCRASQAPGTGGAPSHIRSSSESIYRILTYPQCRASPQSGSAQQTTLSMSSSEDNNSLPVKGSKKRRLPHACDNCRKRKVKCE